VPWVRAPGGLKEIGILENSLPLVKLANQLVCTVSVKGRPTYIKQADVVEVLSRDVCVSVYRNDDDHRPICSVDSEDLVYDAIVVTSLFAILKSRPPV
jgi:hypothetical protein